MTDPDSQDKPGGTPEDDDQVFSSFEIKLYSDQGTVELEDQLPPGGLVATLRVLGQRLLDLADYCEVEGVQALLGDDRDDADDEDDEDDEDESEEGRGQ